MRNIPELLKEILHGMERWSYAMSKNSDGKPTKKVVAVLGISSGKDSTVVLAILRKLNITVIPVMLPNTTQKDIDVSKAILKHYGLNGCEINIGTATDSIVNQLIDFNEHITTKLINTNPFDNNVDSLMTNLPARIRMSVLFAIANLYTNSDTIAIVMNTCNASETKVGFSTMFGDNCGGIGVLQNLLSDEVIAIGRELEVPELFLMKPADDGLCGQTDEEKFGFSYEELNEVIRWEQLASNPTCLISEKDVTKCRGLEHIDKIKLERMRDMMINSRWKKRVINLPEPSMFQYILD